MVEHYNRKPISQLTVVDPCLAQAMYSIWCFVDYW